MIILKNDTNPQTFKFIPRKSYDSMFIRDEMTNTETQVTITLAGNNPYYHEITATFSLLEDRFYNLTLKLGSEVVYKDRIFCTNQNISEYSINKDEYTENNSTNDFIIYE